MKKRIALVAGIVALIGLCMAGRRRCAGCGRQEKQTNVGQGDVGGVLPV